MPARRCDLLPRKWRLSQWDSVGGMEPNLSDLTTEPPGLLKVSVDERVLITTREGKGRVGDLKGERIEYNRYNKI